MCKQECLLLGPLASRTTQRLQLGGAPEVRREHPRGLQPGHRPLHGPHPDEGLWAYHSRHRWVWLLPDPLAFVAGGRTKDKWGCSQVHRGWSCLQVCIWDHGQQVDWLFSAYDSYLDPKAPIKALRSVDGCQVIVAERRCKQEPSAILLLSLSYKRLTLDLKAQIHASKILARDIPCKL